MMNYLKSFSNVSLV